MSITTHEDLVSRIHDMMGGEESLTQQECSDLVREHRTERYEDHDIDGDAGFDFADTTLCELYDRIMTSLGA